MRTLFGIALAGALALGSANDARAQGAYVGGVPYGYGYYGTPPAATYSRGYAFKDEPLMSINRSYLGYSNFVYYGPHPPAHSNPPYYGAAQAPVYVPAPAPVYVPARRGVRWFGWRWGYR